MKYCKKENYLRLMFRANIIRKCLVDPLNIFLVGLYFKLWHMNKYAKLLKYQNHYWKGPSVFFLNFCVFENSSRNQRLKMHRIGGGGATVHFQKVIKSDHPILRTGEIC